MVKFDDNFNLFIPVAIGVNYNLGVSIRLITCHLQVFLKLYGQREKFFHRKIQVVDSFIVAISFALDIAVIIINDIDSSILNGLSLIIILRLWRLVRIVNGKNSVQNILCMTECGLDIFYL